MTAVNELTKDILLLHKEAFLLKKKQGTDLIGTVNVIVKLFNSTLNKTKAAFVYHPVISGLTEIAPTPTGLTPITLWQSHGKAEEVYIQTVQMMNALDIEVNEPEEQAAPLVQLAITQQVSQFMNFNYDQLIQTIQQQNVESNVRQEAEAAVNKFRDEIAKPKPDHSKLKSYLDTVMLVGKEFAIPLLIKLFENWAKIFPPSSPMPK